MLLTNWKSAHKFWSVWAIIAAIVLETLSDFLSEYIPLWASTACMFAALLLRIVSQEDVISWLKQSLSR